MKMDDQWKNNLYQKLDKIVEHNHTQDVTLTELASIAKTNSAILEEHKNASIGNGKRIKYLENEHIIHLNYIKGWTRAIKWILGVFTGSLTLVSVVLGIIYTIKKIF